MKKRLTKVWRKSSLSGESNCLEARRVDDDDAQIRDSKAGPDGPVLHFTGPVWRAFLRDVKIGALDPRNHV